MNMDPRERGEGVEVQALPRALQVAVQQLDGNGGSRSHVVEANQHIGDDCEMFLLQTEVRARLGSPEATAGAGSAAD